ncbi:MAG: hypothetical protein JWQ25_1014 [Daejeonella sp.]|nr:hypothetical protein [Daejeonella sp.]
MLSQISWQQFIASFAVTGLLYYAIVIIIYYRRELVLLLKDPLKAKKVSRQTSLQVANFDRSVLGEVIHSKDFTTTNPEDLNFSWDDLDAKLTSFDESRQIQISEDNHLDNHSTNNLEETRAFVNELKNNLTIIKDADGSKQEFSLLFSAATSKYSSLKGHPSMDYINLLTEEIVNSEKLGFLISTEELSSLW